jgi:hypothetical protein
MYPPPHMKCILLLIWHVLGFSKRSSTSAWYSAISSRNLVCSLIWHVSSSSYDMYPPPHMTCISTRNLVCSLIWHVSSSSYDMYPPPHITCISTGNPKPGLQPDIRGYMCLTWEGGYMCLQIDMTWILLLTNLLRLRHRVSGARLGVSGANRRLSGVNRRLLGVNRRLSGVKHAPTPSSSPVIPRVLTSDCSSGFRV